MMHVETFLAILSAAVLLALAFLALIARLNGDDQADDPPVLITPPADEDTPLGDQVDVRAILRRYE